MARPSGPAGDLVREARFQFLMEQLEGSEVGKLFEFVQELPINKLVANLLQMRMVDAFSEAYEAGRVAEMARRIAMEQAGMRA